MHNVTPIWTMLMFRHLLSQATPERCGVCCVLDGYQCDGITAPNGRLFLEEDCTCGRRHPSGEARRGKHSLG